MSNLDVASYNRQGKVYTLANTAAVATTAVGTAATGLIVINPYGSGKKLIMVDWGWASSGVGTGVGNICLAIGASNITAVTNTTPVTVRAADGSGAATSVAAGSSSATLPAADVAVKWLGGNIWVTGGTGDHPYMLQGSLEGSLILVPGSTLRFTHVTTVLTGLGSFTWIEVPA